MRYSSSLCFYERSGRRALYQFFLATTQQVIGVLDNFFREPPNPPFEQECRGLRRLDKHNRQVESYLKRTERRQHRFGRNLRVVSTLADILATADNQEPLEPITSETVKFVLESVPVGVHATADEVVDRLSFDGKAIFEAKNRVIASKERPLDGRKSGEFQGTLI